MIFNFFLTLLAGLKIMNLMNKIRIDWYSFPSKKKFEVSAKPDVRFSYFGPKHEITPKCTDKSLDKEFISELKRNKKKFPEIPMDWKMFVENRGNRRKI